MPRPLLSVEKSKGIVHVQLPKVAYRKLRGIMKREKLTLVQAVTKAIGLLK